MGLLDILNGMQNGPRGGSAPADTEKSGGMSPITMAILGLLAWKAMKHMTGGQAAPADSGHKTDPAALPNAGGGGLGDLLGGMLGGRSVGAGAGGGLGDLLKGGLGGVLAGGAAGSVLSGGLNDLLKQFQQGGHKDAADSWVGKGENKQIAPNDLANALGADQIGLMTQQSGLSREELLEGLSQQLPEVINRLTPDGRLPTEDEAQRWV